MPDTRKRVRIVTGHPGYQEHMPVVLLDGEPLRCVQRIEFDHTYDGGVPIIKLTLVGIDVDMDMSGIPEYMVRVAGPRQDPKDRGEVVPRVRGAR